MITHGTVTSCAVHPQAEGIEASFKQAGFKTRKRTNYLAWCLNHLQMSLFLLPEAKASTLHSVLPCYANVYLETIRGYPSMKVKLTPDF